MSEVKEWYVRTEGGQVYGPASVASLTKWAEEGRIEPSGFVSKDRRSWIPAQLMDELGMKWLIESEPGKVFGPFNRAVVIRLFKAGSVPEGAKAYRLHELDVDVDPEPEVRIEEKIVEKIVEKRVEVPVEKIVEKVVEKIVEVPVEKIVEKIVEVPPPARTSIVVPEVVEAIDTPPPQSMPGGIFKNADRSSLAALESAARRELAAAGRGRFGLFGRR